MTSNRRLLLFALLGPPLGFAVSFWGLVQILNIATGGQSTASLGQLILLPFAYVVGVLPAVGAGLVDHHYRGSRLGPLYTTAAGFALAFIPIAGGLIFAWTPYVLIFGAVGAIPALICSLLARMLGGGPAGPSSPPPLPHHLAPSQGR